MVQLLFACVGCFRRISHKVSSEFVSLITEETLRAKCARVWFVFFILLLGALILLVAHVYSQNLHALFWLGVRPQVALLVLMVALAYSFFFTLWIRMVMYFRHVRGKAGHDKAGRTCCEPSPRSLRLAMVLMGVLVVAAILLGAEIMREGAARADAIRTNCGGADTFSERIEATQKGLIAFSKACHSDPKLKKKRLHLCPGFRRHYPSPSPIVDYLAQLEMVAACSGFCQPYTKALFADSLSPSARNTPCAVVVASEITWMSMVTGVLAMSLGALLLAQTCLIHEYEHL